MKWNEMQTREESILHIVQELKFIYLDIYHDYNDCMCLFNINM